MDDYYILKHERIAFSGGFWDYKNGLRKIGSPEMVVV